MSACVIWMDSEHAKIFKISASGIEKKTMKLSASNPGGAHHSSHAHNAEEHFYHEVATAVGTVEELLVFGSGLGKTHFKAHLEKHHHSTLAKHLVGVETLDHLTDNQILESARKFFKKHNQYTASV